MSAVQAPPAQLPEATTLHNDPYGCPGRGVSHTAPRTTEQVYGHLMPEALQAPCGRDEALDFGVCSLTGYSCGAKLSAALAVCDSGRERNMARHPKARG